MHDLLWLRVDLRRDSPSLLSLRSDALAQVSQLESVLKALESEIQELVGVEGPVLELHPKCLEEM